ncbi:MAG: SDR family NAD(P)-dependent oxidoreductase [Alphaproteobacteria bacterium]|nr:SDR family NAD(P)-dependent oxidoreductase [Alphaproteobacteria bacterium]
MGWTPDQLSDLSDKTVVITGGNSGLGLEAAKILCGKGARVVITSRNEGKGRDAVSAVSAVAPRAKIELVLLDLADPESVATATASIASSCPTIDAVINNAGVMQTPLIRTKEGFELQIATNHLGHFRFDRALFPQVEAAGGRFVAVSSVAHKFGRIALDDLNSEKSYDPTVAYGQSKLANLMYAFELQRRLAARGAKATALAAHPGYSATNLQSAGVGMEGGSAMFRWLYKVSNAVLAQTATEGAYPLVLAAVDPSAKPGAYYGPTGFQQARGPVGESFVADRAKDEEVARKLWELTESLVGPFWTAS